MKAKLRLFLFTIALGLTPILIYIIKTSFSSTVVPVMERDEFLHNVHLRKLNQPFEWHSPGPGGQDGGQDKTNETNVENGVDGGDPVKKLTTCRNSVQGKILIADDQGFVCKRSEVKSNGCCDNSTSTLQEPRYSCHGCKNTTGCCKLFEFCISCCMNPSNKELLKSVLKEANALSNILLLSVSDHFELCLAKCRTSSRSVQHENLYIDPHLKYCFSKGPVPTTVGNSIEEQP